MYIPRIYTADGETDTFSISFPYLSKEHIRVKVDGELVEDVEFPTKGQVLLKEVPEEGSTVVITRETPLERLVDFNSTSFLSEGVLDLDSTQLLFLVQEALAEATDALGTSSYALWNYDARGKRIANLGDPIFDKDATHKEYVEGKTEEAKGYTDVIVDGIEGRLKNYIDEELMRYAQAYFPEKIIDIPKVLWTSDFSGEFNKTFAQLSVDKRTGEVYIGLTAFKAGHYYMWLKINAQGHRVSLDIPTGGMEGCLVLHLDKNKNIYGAHHNRIGKWTNQGELLFTANHGTIHAITTSDYVEDRVFLGTTAGNLKIVDRSLNLIDTINLVSASNSNIVSLDTNALGHLVYTSDNGYFGYYIPNTNEVLWHIYGGTNAQAKFDKDGYILLVTTDSVRKFSPDGVLLWEYAGAGGFRSVTTDNKGFIYVGTSTGYIYKIAPEGVADRGAIWRYFLGGYVTQLDSDLEGNIYTVFDEYSVAKLNSEVFIEEVELD